jgi:hypothetical protein
VASDDGLDLYDERISVKGQESMARWANTGKVILGGEANHFQIAFDDDLGNLVEGSVTDRGEFFIKAELDTDNPRAVGLHKSLSKGKQLGLSVFGKMTEFHEEDGVPVIDGVELTRVMVTPTPANPRTWLEYVGKSLTAADDTPADEEAEPEIQEAADVEALAKDGTQGAEEAPEEVEADAEETEEVAKADDTTDAEAEAEVVEGLGEDSDTPEQAEEEVEAPEGEVEEVAKTEELQPTFADVLNQVAVKAAADGEEVPEAPARQIARSFAQAVDMLFAPEAELSPQEQREALGAVLGKTAAALDEAVPGEQEEMPTWALALQAQMSAIQKALERVNVGAGSGDTLPDNGDNPTQEEQRVLPARKSVPLPEVRPSAMVEKTQTFRDIVKQLFFADDSQLILP